MMGISLIIVCAGISVNVGRKRIMAADLIPRTSKTGVIEGIYTRMTAPGCCRTFIESIPSPK
jgi:hypothetical protein